MDHLKLTILIRPPIIALIHLGLSKYSGDNLIKLLYHKVMGSGGDTVTDRFYNAYYKKLLSPDLAMSSKPALFLNLTFKIMKNDPAPNRVLAFAKRLFQLCSYW